MNGNSQWRAPWYIIAASSIALVPRPIHAQSNIVPDNTLGNEASVITPEPNNALVEQITGGAQRGQNLFHSFEEFNVGEGSAVYFSSPNADIANILSKVTGNNASEIFGTLGTSGASQPDLFLINPNGIVFGENASLDVGGSFVATTADSVQFGEEGFFSATDPDNPPLLTVQPSAFFFNQVNPGTIQNNSVASGQNSLGITTQGLSVPNGESLVLLGGNITLDNGGLYAADGKIELGGLAEAGTVNLNIDDRYSLNFPKDAVKANIFLNNNAVVTASGATGGAIDINAQNLDVFNSSIYTGVDSGFGASNVRSQDLTINSENIAIDGSFIFNRIQENAIGNGGNLAINTNNLSITNGSQVGVLTFGMGDTGNVVINVSEAISLDGANSDSLTGIFARTLQPGMGNVGDTNISTGTLNIANNALIGTNTYSVGNAGDLNIAANSIALTDSASLDTRTLGTGDSGNIAIATSNSVILDNSFIFTTATSNSIGNAGSINLDLGSLSIINGGSISSSSFGQGDAGNITANTREKIEIVGTNGDFSSAIFTEVGTDVEGNAGDINLSSKFLTVGKGARLTSNNSGKGTVGNINLQIAEQTLISGENTRVRADVGFSAEGSVTGGNLSIDTKQLIVEDGAQVSTTTFGEGNAGNLNVNASEFVELRGEDKNGDGKFPGGLFAQVDLNGEGQGGNLTVRTPQLNISDGSKIQVATFGKGNAGELSINAEQINIFNTPVLSIFTTGIFGSVEIDPRTIDLPEGNGGDINITTAQLNIADGGKVSVTTKGIGNAGTLNISATDFIKISGVDPEPDDGDSLIGADVTENATGRGGDINIVTGDLAISDDADLTVSSLGTGRGGNLNVMANNLTLNDNAEIDARTLTTDGGNINLQITDLISLNNNSNISATAGTAQAGGDGGNININTQFIVAFPDGSNDITANAFEGAGGNVEISAESLFGIEARSATPPNLTNDIDASSEFGLDGEISIETPDVDPARGLDNLPTTIVDASRLITRNCLGGGEQQLNKFVITGRGGLPTNPSQALSGEVIPSAEWVNLPEMSTAQDLVPDDRLVSTSDSKVIEAQGWRVKPDGTVVLVAENNTPSMAIPWLDSYSCDL